jgi:tRNA(Ile)-lysidine synthase
VSIVRQAVARALALADGPVLVGFSGGLDSTVLLHAAAELRNARPLVALHVNHGLHPEADAWQGHCARVSEALGVALLTRRVEVLRRGSLEAQARAARYGAFAEALEHGGCLLLAHHRQDQAETALLRLLQGRGLYGMPDRRRLGAGMLVRPLLQASRGDIETYARGHGLVWLDDPSNADEALDRNFLRRRVLPELRERWPQADDALLSALDRSRLADELLGARLGDLAAADALAIDELTAFGLEERVELLRLWLAARGHGAPRRAALAAFLRQLAAGTDRHPELRLAAARLRRYRGRIHLVHPQPALAARYAAPATGEVRLPHGVLRLIPDPTGCVPRGALEVRFRHGGERLQSRGRHRSVKRILQEAGVPPWSRPVYPLLYDARGLLAVPGLAHREPADGPSDGSPEGSNDPATARRVEWLPG